jgi:hypothetical protein
MRCLIFSVVFLTSLLFAPLAAHAQLSAAEALFDQGRAALAAGDLDTACARFRASDLIDPAAGTKANLADCEEKRGRVATAWEAYRAALAKLPPGDSRGTVIQERIAKLEARLPKLVLTLGAGAPKESTVREGEATIGMAATYSVPLPLDPGVHHLVVAAPGRAAKPLDVTLVEGKTTNLAVEPGAVASAVPPPGAPNAEPLAPAPRGTESRSPGPWIVGGIGVAGLIVGGVTGGLVLSNKSTVNAHCTNGPPPTCRDQMGMDAASAVRTLGPVSTVGLVVGAAGVAGAAIWLGIRGTPKASVGVTSVRTGAGLRLQGSW